MKYGKLAVVLSIIAGITLGRNWPKIKKRLPEFCGKFHHLSAVVSEMYFPENFGRTSGRYFEVE